MFGLEFFFHGFRLVGVHLITWSLDLHMLRIKWQLVYVTILLHGMLLGRVVIEMALQNYALFPVV